MAFLSRHGRGHRLSPTEINYRANICGFKMLGCDAAAVGVGRAGACARSTRRGTSSIPDQFIDRTRHRAGHVLRRRRRGARGVRRSGLPGRCSGCLEERRATRRPDGPPAAAPTSAWRGRSSRRGRSRTSTARWGADVIGMTNLTEAQARPRGGDLLRDARARDRLRLLARGRRRTCRSRRSSRSSGRTRPPRGARSREAVARVDPGRGLRLPGRDALRHPHRPEGDPRGGEGAADGPIAGRYL